MTASENTACEVSFIVPARNEEAFLPATLRSIRDLRTDISYECIVVDGDSDDDTAAIARQFDVRLYHQTEPGRGRGRNIGAQHARGDWLVFIDADTIVRSHYLDRMLHFIQTEGLVAATSRCRLTGCRRATVMEATINYLFPRLDPPILPGFNFFIDCDTYGAAGGFPNIPNEDTAFSRRVGRTAPTGYCPTVLVESSARRIKQLGLTGTLCYYLFLDWERYRSEY